MVRQGLRNRNPLQNNTNFVVTEHLEKVNSNELKTGKDNVCVENEIESPAQLETTEDSTCASTPAKVQRVKKKTLRCVCGRTFKIASCFEQHVQICWIANPSTPAKVQRHLEEENLNELKTENDNVCIEKEIESPAKLEKTEDSTCASKPVKVQRVKKKTLRCVCGRTFKIASCFEQHVQICWIANPSTPAKVQRHLEEANPNELKTEDDNVCVEKAIESPTKLKTEDDNVCVEKAIESPMKLETTEDSTCASKPVKAQRVKKKTLRCVCGRTFKIASCFEQHVQICWIANPSTPAKVPRHLEEDNPNELKTENDNVCVENEIESPAKLVTTDDSTCASTPAKVEKKETLKCFCGQTFKIASCFEEHVKLCCKAQNMCDKCGKKFQTPVNLARHKKRHLGLKLACDICGVKYVKMRSLMRHRRRYHPKAPPYVSKRLKCSICGLGFRLASRYEIHLERCRRREIRLKTPKYGVDSVVVESKIAGSAKRFSCRVCERRFQKPSMVIRHAFVHSRIKNFVCEKCGKSFIWRSSLKLHINTVHLGIKEYACDICGHLFMTKGRLNIHQQIHTDERPFVCDTCGKACRRAKDLSIHKLTHTDIFPFPCNICNHNFRFRQHLQDHLSIHTGERNFKCDVCGKMFRLRRDVVIHQESHTNNRPFSCSVCLLTYKSERSLTRHQKKQHSVKDRINDQARNLVQ